MVEKTEPRMPSAENGLVSVVADVSVETVWMALPEGCAPSLPEFAVVAGAVVPLLTPLVVMDWGMDCAFDDGSGPSLTMRLDPPPQAASSRDRASAVVVRGSKGRRRACDMVRVRKNGAGAPHSGLVG
ncbi:MAG: hypothetical protein Q4A16_09940 [Lautropia sp.]|nr:hypothetical protein [Lautropia sp.]